MRRFFKYLALLIAAGALFVAVAIILPLPSSPLPTSTATHYALTNVNVVDTIAGGVATDQTVVIENGKIVSILPAAEKIENTADGSNPVVIDAAGKYLIPGLWDMHTHSLKISPQLHHPLFIRYGVTAARDMSGCLNNDDAYWACPADRQRWQAEAIQGERVAPRYPLQSSYQTNGGSEVPAGYPEFFKVADLDAAKQLAEFYAGQDVDFIKTYTELTAAQFEHLAVAAAAEGLAIAGHRPLSVSLREAMTANMQSIEHGRLFVFECYAGAETFRQAEDPIGLYNASFMRQLINEQDEATCQQLMIEMASSNTRWVPTLTTLKMSAMARDDSFRNDPRVAQIPWIARKLIWEQDINRAATRGNDDSGKFVHGDFLATAQQQVAQAHSAGVTILAGTDNIDTYVYTGSSLHDELAMFVTAGLTPLQALQTATIDAARFANLEADFGSIAVGKQADLVLLNANPLQDIQHTRDIAAVMFAGRWYAKADLQALEDFAEAAAASVRVNLRYLYDMFASPLMRAQLVD
ncbi:MAG: amidohydrolase family protein [Pseudomonadales bacterium]